MKKWALATLFKIIEKCDTNFQSQAEYAGIISVYGFCDENNSAASNENQTFVSVFNYLKENGTFPTSKELALNR